MAFRLTVCVLIGLAAGSGCRKPPPPADVAASNTFLAAAARDLLGPGRSVACLAGPGMCPGHFDVRPGQVSQLRRCGVLLRLDFQKGLDARLAGPVADGLRIVEVRLPGGLCEPASYLAACRQAADALVDAGLLDRPAADRRLRAVEDRMERLSDDAKAHVAALKNGPVLTSNHQDAFCRWLGLEVAATFRGADAASVGEVDRAVRAGEAAGVRLVIANRPEGRRLADALAARLDAAVVVFDNFPATGEDRAFDALVRRNVDALVRAAGP